MKNPASHLISAVRRWFRTQSRVELELEMRQRLPRINALATTIPADIKDAWFKNVVAEVPGWCPDEQDWRLASLALLQFFEACSGKQEGAEGGACALPSRAADSVWHVWLEQDPQGLTQWQELHFGRQMPHLETAKLGSPRPVALARSFTAACRSEGRSPLRGELPLLFILDKRLGVPGGWAYERSFGRISHRDLDDQGQPTGIRFSHAALTAASLAGLGLLSQEELQKHARQRDGGGSSCGASGSGGCGGSGGSGGGCSCGSTCGGGGCGT